MPPRHPGEPHAFASTLRSWAAQNLIHTRAMVPTLTKTRLVGENVAPVNRVSSSAATVGAPVQVKGRRAGDGNGKSGDWSWPRRL